MYTMNKNLPITAARPIHHIESSNGGAGHWSGSLGEQWTNEQLSMPVEAIQDYTLLAYVDDHRWCIIAAYTGDAE
jgi:hypothetical protein